MEEQLREILNISKRAMPEFAEIMHIYVEELTKRGFNREEAITLAAKYQLGK